MSAGFGFDISGSTSGPTTIAGHGTVDAESGLHCQIQGLLLTVGALAGAGQNTFAQGAQVKPGASSILKSWINFLS